MMLSFLMYYFISYPHISLHYLVLQIGRRCSVENDSRDMETFLRPVHRYREMMLREKSVHKGDIESFGSS